MQFHINLLEEERKNFENIIKKLVYPWMKRI